MSDKFDNFAFYDEVIKKLDTGVAVNLTYLYLAKLFDTVPQK